MPSPYPSSLSTSLWHSPGGPESVLKDGLEGKGTALRPDDPCLIPGIHMVKENQLTGCPRNICMLATAHERFPLPWVRAYTHTHVHMYTQTHTHAPMHAHTSHPKLLLTAQGRGREHVRELSALDLLPFQRRGTLDSLLVMPGKKCLPFCCP